MASKSSMEEQEEKVAVKKSLETRCKRSQKHWP